MEKLIPTLSIIIPVYNVENYLDKCLDSILNQNFSDFEVLLIDDGSIDLSGKICDQYVLKDERVKVYHKENRGVSSARNFGLSIASGHFITFVDSDDWVDRCCYSFFYDSGISSIDMIIWGMKIVFDTGKIEKRKVPLIGYFKKDRLYESLVECDMANLLEGPTNKLFRNSIIKLHNLSFDETISNLEDMDFILKYIQKIESLKVIDQCEYNYRKILDRVTLSTTVDSRVIDTLRISVNSRLSIFKSIDRNLYIKYNHFLKQKIDKYLYFNVLNKYLTRSDKLERLQTIKKLFEEADSKSFMGNYIYIFIRIKSLRFMNSFLWLKYFLFKKM